MVVLNVKLVKGKKRRLGRNLLRNHVEKEKLNERKKREGAKQIKNNDFIIKTN